MILELGIAAGTIGYIAYTELTRKNKEWEKLMSENKLDDYRLIESIKTDFGYKYVINCKGLSYSKLEAITDKLESYYNCKVEMEQSYNNKGISIVYLITNPINDTNTKFKPYRTKPNEIYVSIDNRYRKMIVDLNKYPHALISGTTGSGKTEQIRVILTNLIANYSSRDVEIYFSDLSNMCDYSVYAQCRQVKSYAKDIYNSVILFNYIMHIYKKRLGVFDSNSCKNIKEYNEANKSKRMSYIYVVCDEFADYFPSNKNDSDYEQKLACYEVIKHLLRKARKVGIFLIIGIQRPCTSVLDPAIKSLLCTKIGFTQNNTASSLVACDTSELTNIENRQGLLMYGNQRNWFRSIYLDDYIIENCTSGSIDKDHKDILFSKNEIIKNDKTEKPNKIEKKKKGKAKIK